MLEMMLQGLSLIGLEQLLWMLVGVFVCQVIVIIPGLGGHFAVLMLLPFMYVLEPLSAIGLFMGASVTTGTGNTITGVFFGVPGSPTGIATIFDGFPLAQRGEGARAVAAGLTASVVGGVFGALVLGLSLPVIRPIVLSLSSPEFVVLIIAAIVSIALLRDGEWSKGIISGLAGLMLSFIGQEINTGTLRYTFGTLYLWDGLAILPVFMGLFAVAEMFHLVKRGGAIAKDTSLQYDKSGVRVGILDAFRYWKTTLRSSAIGVLVGVLPGMGGSAAQFIAYAQAAQLSPEREQFGKGAIEGVISSDAAVNATDAGSLVPTLAFGIPGSSGSAIMLAAFLAVGIRPGPDMLTKHLDIFWMIVWILILANVIAGVTCLLATKPLAKLTFVEGSLLVPPILFLALVGSYSSGLALGDLVVCLIFGFVGYVMMMTGYSRPNLVIGYVLGIILERHLFLSTALFGLEVLFRPAMLTILAVLSGGVFLAIRRRKQNQRKSAADALRSLDA